MNRLGGMNRLVGTLSYIVALELLALLADNYRHG
jgi:hypothetical protein